MADIERRTLSTSELQDLNNSRLSGISDKVLEMAQPVGQQAMQDYGFGQRANALLNKAATRQAPKSVDFSEQAERSGWGQSRYDTVNPYLPGQDIEEARALEQSSFAKIGSGLMKGGVTAATTAVNTTLGTVFGAFSSLFELATRAMGEGNGQPGVKGVINAGVNNWLSERLINLQKLSEEWFPNYRTEQERSEQYQREWWKHMGTANFIGDSFLKNFGFTVGAMAGGVAWSKVLQRGLFNKLSGDILKSSIAAAEGDSVAYNEMKALADAVRSGNFSAIDPNKLAVSIENAAKQLNKADSMLQLFGSTVSAMGEGTSEGLMAKQEFLDEELQKIETGYNREVDNYMSQLLNSKDPNIVAYKEIVDENGRPIYTAYLTPEGERKLNNKKAEIELKYARLRDQAQEEGDKLAATTYLLNLPILTTSNLVQFGRMFSGGWTTAKKTAASVSGAIARSAPEEAAKGTAKGIGKIVANYGGKGNAATKAILNSLKVASSESFEEMAQGVVSSGAKQVGTARMLASYNNDGYDPDAIDSVREWLAEMIQGGQDYLGDIQNWQEGALGALTGLIGIPGKVWQSGNRWNGGVPGAISDAKAEIKASRDAAETLNRRVNSPDFQERWHSYIRHLKYDNKMQDAVVSNDQYAWQNNNDKQLINDVMAFADAGRLNDLLQIVSTYGAMSEADASSLREVLQKDDTYSPAPGNDLRNMSDEDIVSKVKEQAKNITDNIEQYKRVTDALSARMSKDTPKSLLNEMVFTAMQIHNFENRFVTILDETIESLNDILELDKYTSATGENNVSDESQKLRLNEIKNSLKQAFSSFALPVQLPKKTEAFVASQLLLLNAKVEEYGNEAQKQKVEDMLKLAEDRKAYYKKFETLQTTRGAEQHAQESITQEDVNKKSAEEFGKIETDGIASVDQVKQAYRGKEASEIPQYMQALKKASENNDVAKRAYNLLSRFTEFKDFADSKDYGVGPSSDYKTDIPFAYAITDPVMIWMFDRIFDNVSSEEELRSLPDSVFPSFAEWKNNEHTRRSRENNPFFPDTVDTYNTEKEIIRRLMADYLKANNITSTRKMNPTPVKQKTTGDTKPVGTEPSQPASTTEPPYPSTSSKPKPIQPSRPADAPAREPDSPSESSGLTIMAAPASTDELLSDADIASQQQELFPGENELLKETQRQVKGNSESRKKPFYHTGCPEVESKQAALAREGGEKRRIADLSDFVEESKPEKNKGFRKLGLKLASLNAFEHTAKEVCVGDEIEFIRFQNEDGEFGFPRVGGREQIVMRLKKNGHILNTLVESLPAYYNLDKLKAAFDEEYKQWKATNPASTEVFVFSKTSKVWLRRPGQIAYNYAVTPDGFVGEQSVVNKPGYEDDAPIVFITKASTPIVIRGNEDALDNFRFSGSLSKRRGALYYMAKDGSDGYLPIRLFVEHFTPESIKKDIPIISEIKDIIEKFANAIHNTKSTTIVKSKLSDLVKVLDLSRFNFEVENVEGVGISLKISDAINGDEEPVIIPTSEITGERLINVIAGFRPSLQIKEDMSPAYLEKLLDSGALTTNAEKLWAKGVDFYIDAWDGSDFGPITQKQKDAIAKRESALNEKKRVVQQPETQVSQQQASNISEESFEEEMQEDNDDNFSYTLEGLGFRLTSDNDEFAGIRDEWEPPVVAAGSVAKEEAPVIKRSAKEATQEERDFLKTKLNANLDEALSGYEVSEIERMSVKNAAGQLMLLDFSVQDSIKQGITSSDTFNRINSQWNLFKAFAEISELDVDKVVAAVGGKMDVLSIYANPERISYDGMTQDEEKKLYRIFDMMTSTSTTFTDIVFDVAAKMRSESSEMGLQSIGFNVDHIDLTDYNNLSSFMKEQIKKKGMDQTKYNALSKERKEELIRCIGA